MSRRAIGLTVSVTLFVGWLGWLAYLAATASRPIVLRRPQFLASSLVVAAEVTVTDNRPAAQTKVLAVYRSRRGGKDPTGETITVENLPDAVVPGESGP